MKITFLIPPVLDKTQDVDRCFGCNYGIYFLPLLPVLYCATLLKDEAEVHIYDFAAEKKTPRDFRGFIEKDNSDAYVFYTVFLSQNTDLEARRIIRGLNKNAHFIFSGPQATYAPEVFLDNEDTVAARGEPEFTVRDIIIALENGRGLSGISGVSYFKDSGPVNNPSRPFVENIDTIPIPDRSLLNHTPYFNPKLHKMPHTSMLTSRGCFGQCWYCVPNSLSYARELEYKKEHGRKPPARLHSVERVVEEFSAIKKLGFKSISVIDDEFIWSEERTVKICEGIKDLGLEWSCLARSDMVNEKIAEAMAKAGCYYIDLGTESFDAEVLKAIRKEMLPEDTIKAVGILKKYGIKPEINVLLGATPKETEATVKKTLREVAKLDADYVLFSIANPFPGTDFYEAARQNNWLAYGRYVAVDPAKNAIVSYPHLSKKKLERYVSYAYFTYYFNPRYLLRQVMQIRSFGDFKNKFLTALNFIRRNFLKL